jgi:hypothetical protein
VKLAWGVTGADTECESGSGGSVLKGRRRRGHVTLAMTGGLIRDRTSDTENLEVGDGCSREDQVRPTCRYVGTREETPTRAQSSESDGHEPSGQTDNEHQTLFRVWD